jgi:hypothetical protein
MYGNNNKQSLKSTCEENSASGKTCTEPTKLKVDEDVFMFEGTTKYLLRDTVSKFDSNWNYDFEDTEQDDDSFGLEYYESKPNDEHDGLDNQMKAINIKINDIENLISTMINSSNESIKACSKKINNYRFKKKKIHFFLLRSKQKNRESS